MAGWAAADSVGESAGHICPSADASPRRKESSTARQKNEKKRKKKVGFCRLIFNPGPAAAATAPKWIIDEKPTNLCATFFSYRFLINVLELSLLISLSC